ncbi:hypothetical protein AB0I81_06810 [Nonomuraea sp. NPDC050404]|uniref:hypothetical protein n=1 Tax=Nonomuraea sp. NPDC050404 TaxID=3155783 RepID=UPI0033F32501
MERIDTARRRIERLREEHADDVTTLNRLIDGTEGDRLMADFLAWDRAFEGLFAQALAMVDDPPPARPQGRFR